MEDSPHEAIKNNVFGTLFISAFCFHPYRHDLQWRLRIRLHREGRKKYLDG
jgi:hypothetical protein